MTGAPLFVSFLASPFGLNKLPDALRKVIQKVPRKIENALRKGVQSFAKKANGGTAVKEKNSSLTTNKGANGAASNEFTYGGTQYRLVVAAESKGGTTIKIVEKATGKLLHGVLTAADFFATDSDARQKFNDLFNAANNLRNAAKKPTAGQQKPEFSDLKALQADVNAKRAVLISEMITDHSCESLSGGCFGAGTMLAVEGGYKAIEDITAGERVMSRDQWNEGGAISGKIVEEVFERYAGVMVVRADGRDIRTTHEHPFFVAKKGWTPGGWWTSPRTARTRPGGTARRRRAVRAPGGSARSAARTKWWNGSRGTNCHRG
jgi:hypothetical protein